VPQLPPEWIAHLAAGVAYRIASCSADGTPGLCRALAAEALPDGRLRVFFDAAAGPDVHDAVRETGRVAVVMGLPSTHRSLHVKGVDAQVAHAGPEHRPLLEARFDAFAAQLAPFGFQREVVGHRWYGAPDDLTAITFTLSGAWNQTPGPGAGQPVELLS
jgi:hypothetical protein